MKYFSFQSQESGGGGRRAELPMQIPNTFHQTVSWDRLINVYVGGVRSARKGPQKCLVDFRMRLVIQDDVGDIAVPMLAA